MFYFQLSGRKLQIVKIYKVWKPYMNLLPTEIKSCTEIDKFNSLL